MARFLQLNCARTKILRAVRQVRENLTALAEDSSQKILVLEYIHRK